MCSPRVNIFFPWSTKICSRTSNIFISTGPLTGYIPIPTSSLLPSRHLESFIIFCSQSRYFLLPSVDGIFDNSRPPSLPPHVWSPIKKVRFERPRRFSRASFPVSLRPVQVPLVSRESSRNLPTTVLGPTRRNSLSPPDSRGRQGPSGHRFCAPTDFSDVFLSVHSCVGDIGKNERRHGVPRPSSS